MKQAQDIINEVSQETRTDFYEMFYPQLNKTGGVKNDNRRI